MSKPEESAFCKDLISGLTSKVLPGSLQFVVDGGYLLHKVRWQAPCDTTEILQKFAEYMRKFGPDVHVMFDCYEDGPSTKTTNTHLEHSNSVA